MQEHYGVWREGDIDPNDYRCELADPYELTHELVLYIDENRPSGLEYLGLTGCSDHGLENRYIEELSTILFKTFVERLKLGGRVLSKVVVSNGTLIIDLENIKRYLPAGEGLHGNVSQRT